MNGEKSCGAVIFIRTSGRMEYLLVQSSVSSCWGFAKGHMEEGESEVQTARREILEETKLKVKFVEGFRMEVSYSINKVNSKKVVLFLAEAENDNVCCNMKELKGYAWMNFHEAYEKLRFDNLKQVLKEANEFIR